MKRMFHLTNCFKANARVVTTSAEDQNIAGTQQSRGQLPTHLPLSLRSQAVTSASLDSAVFPQHDSVVLPVSEFYINKVICCIFFCVCPGYVRATHLCGWCSHGSFILIVIKRLWLSECHSPTACLPSPGLTSCSTLEL